MTQEQVDWDKQPIVYWTDVLYPQMKADANNQKSAWSDASIVAGNINGLTYVSHLWGGNPLYNFSNVPISRAFLMKDYCPIDPIPDLLTQYTGIRRFQNQRFLSTLAAELYTDLAADPKHRSTETYLVVRVPNSGSVMTLTCCLRAAVDTDGVFYLIAKEPVITGEVGRMPSLSFGLSVNGQTLMQFPSYQDYHCLTFPVGKDADRYVMTLGVNFSGVMIKIPSVFGVSLVRDQYSLDGSHLTKFGGLEIDGTNLTFFKMLWDDPDKPYLRAVAFFHGAYKYHPLTTGHNLLPGAVSPIPASVLDSVYQYCLNHYGQKADTDSADLWRIMTNMNPMGDCEDWALTEAQMLLDMGYSIANIRMEYGFEEQGTLGDDGAMHFIGHMWLLVTTESGTVALDNGGVHSLSTIRARYPKDRRTQVDGKRWEYETEAGSVYYNVDPWPYSRVEIDIARSQDAAIEKF